MHTQSNASEKILSHLCVPVWIFDVDNKQIVSANQEAITFWSAESEQELYSRDLARDMSPNVQQHLIQVRNDCAERNVSKHENWTVFPKGNPQNVEAVMSPYPLQDGRQALMIQIVEERQNETSHTLRSAQALLHTNAMISLYTEDLTLLYSNPAARRIATQGNESLAKKIKYDVDLKKALKCLVKHGEYKTEIEVNTKKGTAWHVLDFQYSRDAASGEKAILLSATDATQQRLIKEEIYNLAYTDSLTGLKNRFSLLEKLSSLCDNKDEQFALVFLDLDRFKLINDTLGHDTGDKLLMQVAQNLNELCIDEGHIAYRLAGDEFVIVLKGYETDENILGSAERIYEGLKTDYVTETHSFPVTASMGISVFPRDGKDASTMLKHADVAMYEAKKQKAQYKFFNKAMKKSLEVRLELESDIANAIRLEQFEIYYQPRVCSDSLTVIGMEALLRWNHPEKGMISPVDFVPVAEDTGMILALGAWVISKATKQQAQWKRMGYDISVSINASPSQITSGDFVETMRDAIEGSGCDPDGIEIEITESMLLGESKDLLNVLDQLSELGIKLALDDFGTGYSNLVYLQNYPLNCLKIDKEFVGNMRQQAILELIIRMGKLLNLRVVAEGVETQDQADWLRQNACDELQGFFFSRPMEVDSATQFIMESLGTSGSSSLAA